jgi:hypothetical protein
MLSALKLEAYTLLLKMEVDKNIISLLKLEIFKYSSPKILKS